MNEVLQAWLENDLAIHLCLVDVCPALGVAGGEILFLEITHHG